MKKIVLITLSISTLLTFAACNKFLDVYPEDKLIYEQLLGSEPAINNVLNGIYMDMAQGALYGGNLSSVVLECMAQQYDLASQDQTYYQHARYAYDDAYVRSIFSTIWTQMYKQVLNINDFIHIVNNATVNIPENRKNILLGEAHALRAFYHFDLLRLFGPVYNSPDSTSKAIPYHNVGDGTLLPLLPANEVMAKIAADLQTAETLLQNDPIKTDGIVKTKSSNPVADFYTNRHYRMNYYAVKALQARAWLWRGNKEAALAAAKTVLDAPLVQSGKLFRWVNRENDLSSLPDRVFSPEVIFGIRNRSMYNYYDTYFAGSVQLWSFLCPRPNRLSDAYDNNMNDYRYEQCWQVTAGKSDRTFVKYLRPNDLSATDSTFAYFQPMIRKAELYFIIAECELDPATGAESLTEVRRHRGFMEPTVLVEVLSETIGKEYRREMYGEGQLFYYYKRTNTSQIPDGSSDAGMVTMNADKYRVPLPLDEREAQVHIQ